MMKRFSGIQMKFLGIAVIVILITLASVGGIVSYKVNKQAKNDYINNSNEQLKIVASSIKIFYDQIDKDINMMAKHPLIIQADDSIITYKDNIEKTQITPSKNEGIEQQIYEVFKHYAETHEGTMYVYLGTEEGGYIQWPETTVIAHYDPVKRGWYSPGIKGNGAVARTAPYIDTYTNSLIVSNVSSFTDKTGKVLGVIGIDVQQSVISDMLSQMKIGETGFSMIVHSTGVILAAIDSIAVVANEGANGTVDISNRVVDANYKSNEVMKQVLNSKESAYRLKEEVAKFKI